MLFKRGMGITLEESLNACEYVASGGNRRIVFCLRGMKTNLGDPHRNFVDFSHVPVVKRLTRLPVCVDPSHSVGSRALAPDGLLDVSHVTAQGVVAGANLVLVDFHPRPEQALCDGPQALLMEELPRFLDDVAIVREAYAEGGVQGAGGAGRPPLTPRAPGAPARTEAPRSLGSARRPTPGSRRTTSGVRSTSL